MATRVAIQGYKGCFHEQAARLFYSSPSEHPSCHSERSEECLSVIECDTFEQLYEALDEDRADAAIMAIENTVSGYVPFVHTVCSHGAPLVVVGLQPQFIKVAEPSVLRYVFRRQVVVVVKDGLVFSKAVVKLPCCFVLE